MNSEEDRQGTVPQVDPRYVSTGVLARALGVSVRSIHNWVADGSLEPDHRTPGGHLRWDLERVRDQLSAGRPRPRRRD